MFTKKLAKILLAALFITGLIGCAPIFDNGASEDTTAPELTGDPIVIGGLMPLSGPGAASGITAQRVIQIAVKNINNSGGINGSPLQMEFADGRCAEDAAKTAAEDLINLKGVKVIIGGLCGAETLAAVQVAEKNKVILFSFASSNQNITSAGDFIFRNYPSDATQGSALATYATSKEYKKVGVLAEETSFTQGIIEAFKAGFSGETAIENFAADTEDFSGQITKLKEATVDTVFIAVENPDKVEKLLAALESAEIARPFLMNDTAISAAQKLTETYGDYLEGTVGVEPTYDKENENLANLQKDYEAVYEEELPYLYITAPAYDAVYIIKEALETAGEDAIKIKDYLYTIKGRKGLAGELSFDENGDSNYSYVTVIMRGGTLER